MRVKLISTRKTLRTVSFAHLRAVDSVTTEKGFIAHPNDTQRPSRNMGEFEYISVFNHTNATTSLSSLECRKGSSNHNGLAGTRLILPLKTAGQKLTETTQR